MKQQNKPFPSCLLGEKHGYLWTLCLADRKCRELGRNMWTMCAEAWRTPPTKYENEQKSSKATGVLYDDKWVSGKPFKKEDRCEYTNYLRGRTFEGHSTNHGLAHTGSSSGYQIRCIMFNRWAVLNRVLHFIRLKPCANLQLKQVRTLTCKDYLDKNIETWGHVLFIEEGKSVTWITLSFVANIFLKLVAIHQSQTQEQFCSGKPTPTSANVTFIEKANILTLNSPDFGAFMVHILIFLFKNY